MERSPPHLQLKYSYLIKVQFFNVKNFTMNKQKIICRTVGLQFLLLTALLFMNSQNAMAQKETTENKLLKYELSIDLVPIIDQGQFGKVYFKINRYKEDQLKGAYRIGVSKGTYYLNNTIESSYPESLSNSFDKFYLFEVMLSLGYEKYKQIGPVLTYYGFDIMGSFYKEHHTPQNYTDDQKVISLGVCPFWGIKHYIYKSHVSVAFEVGWENSFGKNTNQYDGTAFYFTHSDLRLPYNFTINYHF